MFYGQRIDEDRFWLDEEEAHHCVRVFRHKEGEQILVTSGEGVIWDGRIVEIAKRSVSVSLTGIRDDQRHRPAVSLGIAPTKNLSRIEWLMEKGVELGLRRLTPLITDHGEKVRIRKDRLERIALAAVKQSLKAWMPVIDDPIPFDDWLQQNPVTETHSAFIGYCGSGEKAGLTEHYRAGSDVIIGIGPEGDFSSREIGQAMSAGFTILDLGPDRFRTETAALHAIGIVYEINRHAKIY